MKHISIIFILLVLGFTTQAQNNSIKGIVWGLGEPIFTFGVWQGALSYERSFTQNHSLVLDGSVIFASGYSEDCSPYSILYSGSVSYRYYFISKRKFLDKWWLSPGLKYQKYDQQSCYEEGLSDFYGVRLIIGKQLNLAKRDNWKIDIGVGTSFGNRVYSYHKEWDSWGNEINKDIPDPYFSFLPEIIFRIGPKF